MLGYSLRSQSFKDLATGKFLDGSKVTIEGLRWVWPAIGFASCIGVIVVTMGLEGVVCVSDVE